MFVIYVDGEEVDWPMDETTTFSLKFTKRAYDTGSDCMVGITPTEGWKRDVCWYQLIMRAPQVTVMFA